MSMMMNWGLISFGNGKGKWRGCFREYSTGRLVGGVIRFGCCKSVVYFCFLRFSSCFLIYSTTLLYCILDFCLISHLLS